MSHVRQDELLDFDRNPSYLKNSQQVIRQCVRERFDQFGSGVRPRVDELGNFLQERSLVLLVVRRARWMGV